MKHRLSDYERCQTRAALQHADEFPLHLPTEARREADKAREAHMRYVDAEYEFLMLAKAERRRCDIIRHVDQ
jgi:hypothetical protein